MKKPISKSASETPKASSPSGTSKKTDDTVNPPISKFSYILDFVRKRTPEETRQALIRAGIINEDGTLTDHYMPKAKKKAKKKDA